MLNLSNLLTFVLLLLHKLPLHVVGYGIGVPFVKHYGEMCDWRSQSETCDHSRGLACSFLTETCDCWDARKIFSNKVHRCVGKASEECSYFGEERLCTESAYCVDNRSFSPIPICVCLKGYFRTDNGSCVKYSKFGEACEHFPPNRLACDGEIGLKCMGYTCQCEPNHIYDPVRELCIVRAGHSCSRTLNNCIEFATCDEKTWAVDHLTGITKHSGYRCRCKPGLRVTDDGLCFSDYSGHCNTTKECIPGQKMTCLNNICQCLPLSQIYSKTHRQCFNVVGTKCKPQTGIENTVENELGGDKNDNSSSLTSMKNVSRTNSKISSTLSTPSPSMSSSSAVVVNASTSTPSMLGESKNEVQFDHDGTERAECIPNSQCIQNAHGTYHCQCVAGSSQTIIKTCLLDYGQDCSENEIQIQSRAQQIFVLEKEMKCNVFEALSCRTDLGKCQCADPSLVYDKEKNACLSRIGDSCGNLKLGMLDLSEDIKDMIFINCEKNSTCLELTSGGGISKRVCVPFNKNNNNIYNKGIPGNTAAGSLSKFMFNNVNGI